MVELVSQGHPDKVADAISDVVVREYLMVDKNNKVACETLISNGNVFLCGEVLGSVDEEILHEKIKNKIREIGYTEDYVIHDNLVKQSPELTVIANNQLANDQCVVYGYACDGPCYMPMEYYLAHDVLRNLKEISGLKPDAKVLVDSETKTIKLSTSHCKEFDLYSLRETIKNHFERLGGLYTTYKIEVNPAGTFIQCGPDADCGVTGRKIVVDSYGTGIPVGGGAFSGKDFTKLDRSAAYMSRIVAIDYFNSVSNQIRNIKSVLIETSYMIGDIKPKVTAVVTTKDGASNRVNVTGMYSNILSPKFVKDFFNKNISDVTELTWCPFLKIQGSCLVQAVDVYLFNKLSEKTENND